MAAKGGHMAFIFLIPPPQLDGSAKGLLVYLASKTFPHYNEKFVISNNIYPFQFGNL